MPGSLCVSRSLALTPPIPTVEPDLLYAGDTAQWTKSFSDYPKTDGWVLTYSFRGPTSLADVTAPVDPLNARGWLVTLTAGATAVLSAGVYTWTAKVALAGVVTTVARGTFVVELTAAAVVTSQAQQMVTLLETVIASRIAGDVQEYTIDGRSAVKIPIEELHRMLARYKHQVWRQKNPGQSSPDRKVVFR